jgi:hypothetical protein
MIPIASDNATNSMYLRITLLTMRVPDRPAASLPPEGGSHRSSWCGFRL